MLNMLGMSYNGSYIKIETDNGVIFTEMNGRGCVYQMNK